MYHPQKQCSRAVGNEKMKQTAEYREERKETDKELMITITNCKLALDEFPLSMYENLIDEIKNHKNRNNDQNLRISILGDETITLSTNKLQDYLYMFITSGSIVYSTVKNGLDIEKLIRTHTLEQHTAINFMGSDMTIYIKHESE